MQSNKVYQEMRATQKEAFLIAEKLKEDRKFFAYAKGKLLQVECRELKCGYAQLAEYVQSAIKQLQSEGQL